MPVRGFTDEAPPPQTQIFYHNANFKGSYDWLVAWLFRQERAAIKLVTEEENHDRRYRVLVGENFDACLQLLQAPLAGGDQEP